MHIVRTSFSDIFVFLSSIWSNIQRIVAETGPVQCELKTNPIIFGNPVIILCQIVGDELCVEDQKRLWIGGQDKTTLFKDGAPHLMNTRYEESIESCNQFTLTIHNFSMEDLNTEYSCYVKFERCKTQITSSSLHYLDSTTSTRNESFINVPSNSTITDNNEMITSWFRIFTIVIVIICTGLVSQSIYRNKEKLLNNIKQLRERQIKDLRRPVLGIICVVVAFYTIVHLSVISFPVIHPKDVQAENPTHISLIVVAMICSPISTAFISNPTTISIRQGFRISVQRCAKKWTFLVPVIFKRQTKHVNGVDGRQIEEMEEGKPLRDQ